MHLNPQLPSAYIGTYNSREEFINQLNVFSTRKYFCVLENLNPVLKRKMSFHFSREKMSYSSYNRCTKSMRMGYQRSQATQCESLNIWSSQVQRIKQQVMSNICMLFLFNVDRVIKNAHVTHILCDSVCYEQFFSLFVSYNKIIVYLLLLHFRIGNYENLWITAFARLRTLNVEFGLPNLNKRKGT